MSILNIAVRTSNYWSLPMEITLVIAHLAFCIAAIVSGAFVVLDLISGRFSKRGVVFFLRCGLCSNVAVLFIRLRNPLPEQMVAMAAVYGAGVAYLAWCRFRLCGIWRATFAFSIAMLFYLNVVALSIQMFGPDRPLASINDHLFRKVEFVLLAPSLILVAFTTTRFARSSVQRHVAKTL